MNPQQFASALAKKQQALKNYVNFTFPVKAGNMALRFINGNFRAQGWQGKGFEKWKNIKRKGTILVKKGSLRRGNYFTTEAGVAHVKNNVKYAAVHNNGFNGTVHIKAHQRKIYQGTKAGSGKFTSKGRERMKTIHTVKSIGSVKAHTRKMNIAKRQYMPTNINDSPVLVNAYRREIERELKKIF